MTEDLHFFERLERVGSAETELALRLYRDPELVRVLLAGARLPDGADRIAVALGAGEDGPVVVVARDGHFVTCLGAGMSRGKLPFLSFGQLGRTLDLVSGHREETRAALDRMAATGGIRRLSRALLQDGPRLCREDWVALRALSPLLRRELNETFGRNTRHIYEARKAILPRLPQLQRRLRDRDVEHLVRLWRTLWTTGHIAALMGEDPVGLADRLDHFYRRSCFSATLVLSLVGYVPVWLRGCWMVARAGKPLLPRLKARWDGVFTSEDMVDAAASLGAVGLRHSGLRAEVRKTLGRTPSACKTASLADLARATAGMMMIPLEQRDGVLHAAFPFLARETVLAANGNRLPEDLEAADDEELATLLLLCSPASLDTTGLMDVVLFLAWAARVSGAQLYLPERLCRHVDVSPAHVAATLVRALSESRSYWERPAPTMRRDAPKTGRNDPCSCGSGRKHKHCCAA
jgi:hypothetical protein